MGVRKKLKADEIKEAKKSLAFAKLNNCPTSPSSGFSTWTASR